jgi:flagellar motor switch protein FliN/FliY
MSSSPSSSSSSSPIATPAPAAGALPTDTQFARFLDVACPVSVVLGTGSISVRECIALDRNSVVRLVQPAGEDLQVFAGGVPIARGEVVVLDEGTAVRLTEVLKPSSSEARA